MRVVAFAIAAVVMAAPARADDGACSSFKWPVNREMAAFKDEAIPKVASGGALPGVVEPASLMLLPQDAVAYPVAPAHKPKHSPAYGGTFTLPPMAAADTYQVTLSDEAWIDVVQDGKLLKQVGFTGAHDCKTVRKSVRFTMGAAPLTVEISDAASASLKIEVLPKEQ